ncbi:hypothetical protein ES708_18217 [subsurface metagenome]
MLSTILVAPSCFDVISTIISFILFSSKITGFSFPECITSSTLSKSFLPKSPLGCRNAKSSGLKFPFSSKTIAKASPTAKAVVLLAVGAKLNGHAFLSTFTSITISEKLARVEVGLPVSNIILVPNFFRLGTIFIISSVSPLLDIIRPISFFITSPKSPCIPSTESKNKDGFLYLPM